MNEAGCLPHSFGEHNLLAPPKGQPCHIPWAHQALVLWLPPSRSRTGTLTIRTMSAATVHIDGLVSLRRP